MIVDAYKLIEVVLEEQRGVQKQISKHLIACLDLKEEDPKLQEMISKNRAIIVSNVKKNAQTLLDVEQDILATLAAEGNDNATEVLYAAFKNYMNAIAYRYTHERDEDAISETYVALIRAIKTYNNASPKLKNGTFSGYLFYTLREQLAKYVTQKTCNGTNATPYMIRTTEAVNKWMCKNTSFGINGLYSATEIKKCAEALDITEKNVEKKIDQILRFNIKYVDETQEDGTLLLERLPGDNDNPLDLVIMTEDTNKIKESFEQLKEKDRNIILDYVTAKKEKTIQKEIAKYGNNSKATYYRRLNKAKASLSTLLVAAGISTTLLEYVIR